MRPMPLRDRIYPAIGAIGLVLLGLACLLAPSCANSAHKQAEPSSKGVPCAAFKKNPNGSWTATRNALLTVGSLHVTADANTTYLPNTINFNGIDFASYLDTHCAAGGKS